MQPLFLRFLIALLGFHTLTGSVTALAQSGVYDARGLIEPAATELAPALNPRSTAGEVRRIDLALLKVTLRHEAITSLNMPPMTMVFRVSDKSLLEHLKPGEAVRFVAEKRGGEYWLTELQAGP